MAMTKVLVKAYIPTINEKRGISLDDIIDGGSLRWVRPGQRNIGMNPRSLSLNQRTGRGQNIPFEIDTHKFSGKSIPGLLDLDNPNQINPNFNVQGVYVGPPNQGFLENPDMTQMPNLPATLLASTENPEFYRLSTQGALTPAEGFKYGGFDKDTVVEIPLPKNITPSSFQSYKFPSLGQSSIDPQEVKDFLEQFPNLSGSSQWFERRGPPADIDELIASGKLQPLSLDQRIQPHESPFLDDDVTTKVASEPMDIAFQLLKEELSRVASSPTMMRQPRKIVANQNPANLPCPKCGNKILQEPCQRCGRPASLGAGTLKSDISKNLNRWFKEKWVDVSRKDKDGKHPPCGRSKASKSSKGYPKCRPSVKVSSKTPKTSGSMSEGQKRAATKRKRAKKQGVGGKPTIVKIE